MSFTGPSGGILTVAQLPAPAVNAPTQGPTPAIVASPLFKARLQSACFAVTQKNLGHDIENVDSATHRRLLAAIKSGEAQVVTISETRSAIFLGTGNPETAGQFYLRQNGPMTGEQLSGPVALT